MCLSSGCTFLYISYFWSHIRSITTLQLKLLLLKKNFYTQRERTKERGYTKLNSNKKNKDDSIIKERVIVDKLSYTADV